MLPLSDHELAFLDRLNGKGEIEASLLTADADLRQRITSNPGLRWKALDVKKHIGGECEVEAPSYPHNGEGRERIASLHETPRTVPSAQRSGM